jgi:hypothetical protein
VWKCVYKINRKAAAVRGLGRIVAKQIEALPGWTSCGMRAAAGGCTHTHTPLLIELHARGVGSASKKRIRLHYTLPGWGGAEEGRDTQDGFM